VYAASAPNILILTEGAHANRIIVTPPDAVKFIISIIKLIRARATVPVRQ
jgi:hypothetical protein